MVKSFSDDLGKTCNVGLDISLSCLKRAKCVYKDVIRGDIENLPIKKCCISTVFSNSVVEHLHNPKDFLSEAQRILKMGGFLIFTTVTDKFEAYSPKYIICYFTR